MGEWFRLIKLGFQKEACPVIAGNENQSSKPGSIVQKNLICSVFN